MFNSLIVLCLGPQGQPWPGWSCCPPLTKPDKQNRTNKQTTVQRLYKHLLTLILTQSGPTLFQLTKKKLELSVQQYNLYSLCITPHFVVVRV